MNERLAIAAFGAGLALFVAWQAVAAIAGLFGRVAAVMNGVG